jgi:hypothetical protein
VLSSIKLVSLMIICNEKNVAPKSSRMDVNVILDTAHCPASIICPPKNNLKLGELFTVRDPIVKNCW